MKYIVFLFCFVIINTTAANNNIVDWDKFNYFLYNKLLIEKIKEIKTEKNISYDSLLLNSAEIHFFNVIKDGDLTHIDSNCELTRRPIDRIRVFIHDPEVVYKHSNCLESKPINNEVRSSEVIGYFTYKKESISYSELVDSTLSIYNNEQYPAHWDVITGSGYNMLGAYCYKHNDKIYSVILFYKDNYYEDNKDCFYEFHKNFCKGKYDDELKIEGSDNDFSIKTFYIDGVKMKVKHYEGKSKESNNGLMHSTEFKYILDRFLKKKYH